MDYWRRNGVEEDDVSIFMMEESGDSSEGHSSYDPEKSVTMNGAGVVVMNYGGVDDAESCSSESCNCHALLDYDYDDDDDIEICDDDNHHQEQGEDHEHDHDHDQKQPPPKEKYCNADESSEVMDAMEDRLFWETCLAVGFSSKP